MNWKLWAEQIAAILRIEIRKNLTRKRAIPVYLLAAGLPGLFLAHAIAFSRGWVWCSGYEDQMVFAGTFQVYTLRLAIFFGAVAIFTNLFRGEVVEKTLHYYFLAPVRREVLVFGKYLAGVISAGLVFAASTALGCIILGNHLKMTKAAPAAGQIFSALPTYVGVAVLACAGYGAVFLILGLLFRNPILPAAFALVWESLIIFMPPLLKKMSVIFYLESLCPVRLPFRGPGAIFAITAEPIPAYVAVPGLVGLTIVVVALAGVLIRRMEIRYGVE